MTFNELTRVMLSSMDFFELRRTAARYGIAYQGVRRSKLLRDLERKITMKNRAVEQEAAIPITPETIPAADKPAKGAQADRIGRMKINTYSSGNAVTRIYNGK